jgi:hypothetical protein
MNLKLSLLIILSVVFLSCKKEKGTSEIKFLITTNVGKTFNIRISSEDGTNVYIKEDGILTTKTFIFTTPKNQKLGFSLNGSQNLMWDYKAYRDGILVKEEVITSGGYGSFF